MQLHLRALSYFRQDLPLVGLLLLAIGASTGIGLLMAWPMAILLDSVLAAGARSDWVHRLFLSALPEGTVGKIVGLAVAGLLLKLVHDLLSLVQTVLSNRINYNGLMRVRCDLYRKLQAMNLEYHRSQPQGDAIYRLTSDTFGCQTILGGIISLAIASATMLAMIWVLGSRSWALTALAFGIVPPLACANVVFGRRLRQRSIECKEQDARFMSVVQRSIACIGLVQAFNREADEFGRFRSSVDGTIRAWWRLNRQQMAYNLLVGTTFGLFGAIVFGYGGYLVYRDQFLSPRPGGLSVGDLVVFTSYVGMLWGPLCTLTGFAANVQGGVAGAQRVFEVLDRHPGVGDAPNAIALPRRPRVLELQNVGFHYEAEKPVLRELSVRIEPGQMVAFVGSSGVGKSTLLNLLPRFYDPTSGAITLDGIDARQVRVSDLRRHVAPVLQEGVMLPTTIAENIAYGCPGATPEQVRAAAKLAGAAEFIESIPESYDTVINEGGSNLSGGQRQRIAIARALMTEAPFIVLDEPTSALDPQHERLVVESLRKLRGMRTIILVSHRLSTVVHCDQIFMMDQGRVVERGTHDQLMAERGAYYKMACCQMEGDQDDVEFDVPPRTPLRPRRARSLAA